MSRIVFIGAGSGVFTRRVVADVLCEPALSGGTIVLMDIAQERLALIQKLVRKMIRVNRCDMKVLATTNRKEALAGADVVVNTIHVGGIDTVRSDFEIPTKHGLKQTVADTTGPGGVFRFIRVAPVLVQIARDMERLCPQALLLNFTNPMCMSMSVVQTLSPIRSVGLCHSVQNVARVMAGIVGKRLDEIVYCCAGVNHMSWYYLFEDWDGNDLYPALRAAIREDPACIPPNRSVNADLFRHFGLFPSEGTHHHGEYHPYYLKNDKEIVRLGIHVNHYLNVFGGKSEQHEAAMRDMLKDPKTFELERSVEYASKIMAAYATNRPVRIHGNVLNKQLLPELPQSIAVESPVYVDRHGFAPVALGDVLPPGPLGRTQALASVYATAVKGYLQAGRELITQAIELDPSVSAQLTLPEIRLMVRDMFRANEDWLREFGSPLARKTTARKRPTSRK
ncbi:MAG: alpha-glucosidase/alpha-galactosidase [Nitrospiraceae bacterium]|nr:alpha-glucosidase/alpha-galactosidase [Nitrospiraceae bacterium]